MSSVFIAVAAFAQLPNAWQINDNTTSSGVIEYVTNLTTEQVSQAVTGGWRYKIVSRILSDSGSAGAQSMAFGDGTRRFYIFFDLDSSGRLTAQLLGNGTNYLETLTDTADATNYHTHEIEYDPALNQARYRFDGTEITAWSGNTSIGQSNQVMWGANASSGRGVMNYHKVDFQILNEGMIASYDAFADIGAAPSPTTQGWTRFTSGTPLLEGSVFADPVPLPTPFVQIQVPGLAGVKNSSVAWADYDNDGRMDFLILGTTNGLHEQLTQLWRNTGSGFTNVPIPGLPQVYDGSVAWADYDNDGRMDFLLQGQTTSFQPITELWRNTGSGFTNVPIPGLPGTWLGQVAWDDYDNDGRKDFLITGATASGRTSQLWRNTGEGFVQVPIQGLVDLAYSSVAWGDYDNDELPDFIITGTAFTNNTSTNVLQLWHNTGNGFEEVSLPGVRAIFSGSVTWADYNGDGWLDFLMSGGIGQGDISELWQNTGSGFSNVNILALPGLLYTSAVWGDFDNDGRSDFAFAGSLSPSITEIWRNTGVTFTHAPNGGMPDVSEAAIRCADYDNDGRLDLLVTGGSTNGYVSQLWRNITPDTNRPPAAEATLTSQQFPDQTHLSWAESSDPESGYSETFNLRVGTTPGGGDIVSPESLASGQRLIPEMGNMQLRPHVGLHLPPGTYYWSVQIVDVAFRGGPFAPEQSFTVEGAPQLSIVHTNENIILSWPPTSGWVLQETAKLEAPDWKNSPSGTNNPVTLPLTNSAMFYRLSHP